MSGYDVKASETKWQDWWEKEGIYHFDFDSDKTPYSIDNPPRYASGPLHAGHAVHYTHIDFAARYHRMKGYNVYFPLCFDVNGMPIEVNVEKKYNIKMRETDRHEFIKLCRDFANTNIGEMTRQFKILGESMDPTIYYQTDAEYYRRVTQVSFIKLFNKGMIYKGEFPINFCTRCSTALAESEVEYQTRMTKLNYINFELVETGEKMLIATTRPELLCTCHMVAVNPEDPRADQLMGKMIKTPIFGKEVRILPDENVDLEFGTGLVMVCSIGDKDDLEWIRRYDLQIERGIDEEGRMTEVAGKYAGMDTKEARNAIIQDMKDQGILVKQEDLEQNVGSCWRCKSPIEYLVAPQWFLKTLDFREEVLARSNEIDWFPKYMKIRLEEWVNSLSWDWVLSRQRYFATPIPIWECVSCNKAFVPREEDCYIDPTIDKPPVEVCDGCGGPIKGSEEVFDTWMDSSLTPLYNAFWQRDDEKFDKLWPMSLRPQSHDIIRTWAFYSILRSHLLVDSKPWDEIMMGGFILAEDGTPMHASKGNAIDPLKVLDEYGADALRYYAATCALGKDNAFRTTDVKRGRQLITKMWNIQNLCAKGYKDKVQEIQGKGPDDVELRPVDRWILDKYSRLVKESTDHCDNYRFEKTMTALVDFLWHDLADNYLEMVKYRIYAEKDTGLVYTLYNIGLGICKLMATFQPHITEEIYQQNFREVEGEKSIHITSWPEPILEDETIGKKGDLVKEVVAGIRRWKSDNGIGLNKPLSKVTVALEDPSLIEDSLEDIKMTSTAQEIELVRELDLEEQVVKIDPEFSKIGPEFKADAQKVIQAIKGMDLETLKAGIDSGAVKISLDGSEKELAPDYFKVITKMLPAGGGDVIKAGDSDIFIKQ